MPATFFKSADIEFALPGFFRVEVRFIEADAGDRTEARLLNAEGSLVTSVNLHGQCPTEAITPLLDDKCYPFGWDDAFKAARMAAKYVNYL